MSEITKILERETGNLALHTEMQALVETHDKALKRIAELEAENEQLREHISELIDIKDAAMREGEG